MLFLLLLFFIGLTSLYVGAEMLVRGGSILGLRLGLSPLAVGLTIVAFGTSAPELAVSLHAAYQDMTDIAIGNVVGSNIANVGLILGLSAMVRPLGIDIKLIRLDIPLMIGASLLLVVLLLDQQLTRADGILMLSGIILFTVFNVRQARRSTSEMSSGIEKSPPRYGLWAQVVLIIAGIALLTLGARWMVDSAVTIARQWGLSEAVIGLTIIAVGTSLPELATSILASAKRMGDISVGNIIGSNLFNILCVLGATSSMTRIPLGNVTWLDILVMMIFSVLLLPLARTGFIVQRWEGTLLLTGYLVYSAWLINGMG